MAHKINHYGNDCWLIPFLDGPLFSGGGNIGTIITNLDHFPPGTKYRHPTYQHYTIREINGILGWSWEPSSPEESKTDDNVLSFIRKVESKNISEVNLEDAWREHNARS